MCNYLTTYVLQIRNFHFAISIEAEEIVKAIENPIKLLIRFEVGEDDGGFD